jgi:fructose-specific phosphotransferase system IIA component
LIVRLTDILQPDCVKVPLEGDTKQACIYELIDLLVGRTEVTDAEALKEAVWQRELTRTTGIGHGIGIPHGKADCVDELRMAIGRPSQPLEFGAIDGKPVNLIILLASPLDKTGPHIQALAKISRLLVSDDLRDALQEAPSSQDLYDLLLRHESQAAV